jgi:hypothetical protein
MPVDKRNLIELSQFVCVRDMLQARKKMGRAPCATHRQNKNIADFTVDSG